MKVYMFRGVSCSGKSTISRSFDPQDVLSSDDFRLRYLGSVSEQRFNKMIFDKMADCLEARLTNMCPFTVIDSTNLKMKDGRRFRELALAYHAELVIIDVEPPEVEVLKERNMKRFMEAGVYIPEHVFDRHVNTYWTAMPSFEDMVERNPKMSMIKVGQDGEIKGVIGAK